MFISVCELHFGENTIKWHLRAKITKVENQPDRLGRIVGVVYRYLVWVELGNTFGMVGEGSLFVIIGPPNLIFVFCQKPKKRKFSNFHLRGKVESILGDKVRVGI